MVLLLTSFIAGLLTILAPCVLPLLPVTLGGAVAGADNKKRPLVIIGALALSVFVFTLLLKGSTALITVSPSFWTYVSAVILILFGLTLLFPETWARLVLKIPGHKKPDSWMASGYKHRGEWWSDVVVGAALGPVFTTCSPTFFLIIATVLPQSLGVGIIDLVAYIIGISLSLLLVAYIGQRLVNKMQWAINPYGWFRKTLGVLFIVLAVLIAFGLDKTIEAGILQSGFFDVTTVEQSIHQSLERSSSTTASESNGSTSSTSIQYPRFTEIQKPAGFVNSEPFKLADYIGKKVILIDFIDYSCINCERTFPFLNDWWNKYKDQGLLIVAIHTPEFSFEKDVSNVTAAAKQYGLMFPIVLDNDYATWNAYQNEYWPHKYLIDIHGNVVYDYIGEGNDAVTEAEIVKQLNVRDTFLGVNSKVSVGTSTMPDYTVEAESPETYFGSTRNEFFGNGTPGRSGSADYPLPNNIISNQYYLGGTWDIEGEYAEDQSVGATLAYEFTSKDMYLVAASADGKDVTATVLFDGKPIPDAWAGKDVLNGKLTINSSRLYSIYSGQSLGRHRIDIIFNKTGGRVYTFTFG